MVCNCGNSHDALVSSQFQVLPGKGQRKGQGNGVWGPCHPVGNVQFGAKGQAIKGGGGPGQTFHFGKGGTLHYGPAQGGKAMSGNGGGKNGGKQSPASPQGGSNVNRWTRGLYSKEGHAYRASPSSTKDTSAAPSESGVASSDPQDVQSRLGTLQAVMSSIKGRSDIEATELRALTEAQMARLRIKSDAAKSLPQQITKIQQAISKKTHSLTEANDKVASLTVQLEEASSRASALNSSLEDLQAKLQTLLSQCSVPVSATPSHTEEQNKQIQVMSQFGSLLPPELAVGFNEAMRHILQLMNMQAQSSDVILVDSDSPMSGASDPYAGGLVTPLAASATTLSPGEVSPVADTSPTEVASAWSVDRRRGRSPRSEAGVGLSSMFEDVHSQSSVRSRSQNRGGDDSSVRRRLRGKQSIGPRRPVSANSASHGEQPSGARYFPPLAPTSPEASMDA